MRKGYTKQTAYDEIEKIQHRITRIIADPYTSLEQVKTDLNVVNRYLHFVKKGLICNYN